MPEAKATRDRRGLWFGLLVAACVAVAAVSVTLSALHGPGGAARAEDGPARPAKVPAPGALVFRSLDRAHDGRYGRIAWTRPGVRGARPVLGGPACERTYYAARRGLCLSRAGSLGASVRVRFLGEDLTPWRELTLPGIPSRARISPDGRLGSVTAFVTGHSYADPGTFSTRTTILDMARGGSSPTSRTSPSRGTGGRSGRSTSTSGASPSPGTATRSTPRSRAAATPIWCAATCAGARS